MPNIYSNRVYTITSKNHYGGNVYINLTKDTKRTLILNIRKARSQKTIHDLLNKYIISPKVINDLKKYIHQQSSLSYCTDTLITDECKPAWVYPNMSTASLSAVKHVIISAIKSEL